MNAGFVAPVIEWAYLAPVLIVLGAGVVGVLIEAFVPDRGRRLTQVILALAATAGAVVAIALLWSSVQKEQGVSVLRGSLMLDPFGLALQGIVVVLAFLGILVIADRTSTGQDAFAPTAAAIPGSPYEDLARRKGLQQTEVYPLVLFAVGGMMIFPATDNLLTMFVALEVLSLPLYVLSALSRRRRLLSQEASFKYFLLGAFASALFIFGVALLYGYAGSVRLEDILHTLGTRSGPLGDMTGLVVTGIVLVLAGLLFKVGAAPFHSWTPDVYQGAPTPITGFMAACTKAAAFGALLRVLIVIGSGLSPAAEIDPDLRQNLLVALWIVAILTMVIGSVIAVIQTDMKRLLAYSSIAHAGFVLVGIIGFNSLGVRATIFYLLAYGLATIGAFAVVTLVREKAPESSPGADDGVVLGEATHLSDWQGLGKRSPWLAAAFSLFLLSMAGIPLTAGFIAKYQAFQAAVAGDATVLAVIGVLGSAIAVFFYVRVIVLMFFTPSPGASRGTVATSEGVVTDETSATVVTPPRAAVTVVRSEGFTAVAIAICAIGVIALGIFPSSVLDLVAQAAIFRP